MQEIITQFGHNAVYRLWQGLERAYSTVRVALPVGFIHASGRQRAEFVGKVKGVEIPESYSKQKAVLVALAMVPRKALGLWVWYAS